MTQSSQVAVDAVFAVFGVDAVLTPKSGDPQAPIRVVPKIKDDVLDFGDARILADTTVFEMRRSEPVTPVKGDTITVGSKDYLIQSQPQILDIDQLVWTLDMRPK